MKYLFFIKFIFLILAAGCQTTNSVPKSFRVQGVETDLKYFESIHCLPNIFAASGMLSGSMLFSAPQGHLPDMEKFEKMKKQHKKVWKAFKIARKYKDKGLSQNEIVKNMMIANDKALDEMRRHVPELVSYCVEKAQSFKRECYTNPINENFSQCVELGAEDLTESVVDFAHRFYKIEKTKKAN